MATSVGNLDLDHLLKLRAVVGRFGEMDVARWWNTTGQLGPVGAMAARRGLPRTHRFAQARSVFAVAAHRCAEVFQPPKCVTLWLLPPDVEEAFDAQWEKWLEDGDSWNAFFRDVEGISASTDLPQFMAAHGLADPSQIAAAARLKRSAEGRGVLLPGSFSRNTDSVTMLALAFARGEPGALAVPYARGDE
jgi:hypothetical protein